MAGKKHYQFICNFVATDDLSRENGQAILDAIVQAFSTVRVGNITIDKMYSPILLEHPETESSNSVFVGNGGSGHVN